MKMQCLDFYWGISAHLLTVLYQMMFRRVHEYGSLGVIWLFGQLWVVFDFVSVVLVMLILHHPQK